MPKRLPVPMMALGGATKLVSWKASASAAASGSTNVKRENTARGGESNHRDQGGQQDGQHYTVVFV